MQMKFAGFWIGKDLQVRLRRLYSMVPLNILTQGSCESGGLTCVVRKKKMFRFHSRIKISLLNKYHF